jgi:hypothetical protein
MKWPDGTPKSQCNAFDWRSREGLSMREQDQANRSGRITQKAKDERIKPKTMNHYSKASQK